MKKIMTALVISTFLSTNLKADVGLQIKGGYNYSCCRDGVSIFKQDVSFSLGHDCGMIKNSKNAGQINYKNERMTKYLLFWNYDLAQIENNINSTQNILTLPKSLIISDEEIKQGMIFGTKEKITSVIAGGFFGGIIGGLTASLFQKDERGYGNIALAFYGIGIGAVTGSIANYMIVKHLASKEENRKIVEKKSKE